MPSLNKILGIPEPVSASICGDVATGLTATGASQGTALAIYANYNNVSTVAASTGVILPGFASVASAGVAVGDSIVVANTGANTLSVYPPTGGNIGTAAANAAFSVATNKTALFVPVSSTQWIAILSA